MNQAIRDWLNGIDTGISSRTIVAVMEHEPLVLAQDFGAGYPLDPADLGRCIRLLDIEPMYRRHLSLMATVGKEWARLVLAWDELEALYREELPTGRAPKCYDRMQEVLKGESSHER